MSLVRTRLNLTSLDRAFAPYIDRGQDLTAPLTLLAQAHAASVDHQFTRRTGILVDGRTVPWDPPSPFGSSPIGEPLERTGRLRQSWQIGHPENITVITPKRVERGTRVPYAAPLRGGTGQFLTAGPLVITPRKAANTRLEYSTSDPRYYAQWWFFLFEFGVAMTAEKFFAQRIARRPHGAWHPNLRRYGLGQMLSYVVGGSRSMRRWQLSEIAA
jgi:hypothetical protein